MSEKMNPEVKARWVAALRSGKYQQGKGELRSALNEFCCLGVLCDLHGDGWQRECVGMSYSYGDGGYFDLPPRRMAEVFGFDWEKVDVKIGGDVATLFDHNDSGRTFAEIADAIEEQL